MKPDAPVSLPVPAAPPELDEKALADAVAGQFGLSGVLTELVSERDRNYRLQTETGARFVVKATSLDEDELVTDFQIRALLYLEQQGLEGVPRIVPGLDGRDRGFLRAADGARLCLRVVSWLDGRLLSEVGMTPAIAGRFGRSLAELNIALRGFSHPGEAQHLLWDSQRADELRGLLDYVTDRPVHDSVAEVLDSFDSRVKPVLPELPRQVIHNDANDDNVLLDTEGKVSGIIDFGDMMRAPRVIDVSTAASYLRAPGDPLEFIEPFVKAYHRANELGEAEMTVLPDLVRTRLAMTLIILYWRLGARDEADPYRQKSLAVNRNALGFLDRLTRLGRKAFLQRIGGKIG